MASERPPIEKVQEECPLCGRESEQIITCADCGMEGCVEDCITGGVGDICSKCQEKEDLRETSPARYSAEG